MKKILYTIGLISCLEASDYIVIAHETVPNFSLQQIRAIYLKKLTLINDQQAIPINLPADSSIRQAFEKKILQMSQRRLKAYWTKQHYLGHRPPLKMASEKSVILFIKKIDGAIGYLEANKFHPTKKIKILYQWSD
ncbi:MAG: hypothetical protein DSY46_00800 [Hydrogenimonas sp.]|nr:MAG: hypothetical protein DSY46_00800 [Hydrogenimonas sp.]